MKSGAEQQRNWNDYAERLARVTDYVWAHLDDEQLDLNRLAEVACLSPYHWHRIYAAMLGETVAATVKRLRLHRAAGLLAHTGLPVTTVARRSGYPNLQSFTRIFKATYGMPPAEYRRNGSHAQFQRDWSKGDEAMDYQVDIRTVPDMTAVTVPHTGSYMDIGRAFGQLYMVLGQRGLVQPGQKMVALYYDDPDIVPEAQLRSSAGVVPLKPYAVEAPLETRPIRGGEYAVLHYKGPYAGMRAAYQWLYGQWLPASGREAADAPAFEDYLNSPRDTAPADLLTDICLPLR